MRGILIGLIAELFMSMQVPICKYVLVYNPNMSPLEILYIKSVMTLPLSYMLCQYYS